MKLIARTGVLVVCTGMLAACLPFPLFEDVGTDPHPPQIRLLGVGYQPIEVTAEGETTPEPEFFPAEGFVVRPNDDTAKTLILSVEFTDLGGDVTTFTLRDLDGSLNTDVTPTAPEVDLDGDGELETLTTSDFFTGTAATVNLENIAISAKQAGPHRLELWAEDSHDSRSEKVSFTINVEI